MTQKSSAPPRFSIQVLRPIAVTPRGGEPSRTDWPMAKDFPVRYRVVCGTGLALTLWRDGETLAVCTSLTDHSSPWTSTSGSAFGAWRWALSCSSGRKYLDSFSMKPRDLTVSSAGEGFWIFFAMAAVLAGRDSGAADFAAVSSAASSAFVAGDFAGLFPAAGVSGVAEAGSARLVSSPSGAASGAAAGAGGSGSGTIKVAVSTGARDSSALGVAVSMGAGSFLACCSTAMPAFSPVAVSPAAWGVGSASLSERTDSKSVSDWEGKAISTTASSATVFSSSLVANKPVIRLEMPASKKFSSGSSSAGAAAS